MFTSDRSDTRRGEGEINSSDQSGRPRIVRAYIDPLSLFVGGFLHRISSFHRSICTFVCIVMVLCVYFGGSGEVVPKETAWGEVGGSGFRARDWINSLSIKEKSPG